MARLQEGELGKEAENASLPDRGDAEDAGGLESEMQAQLEEAGAADRVLDDA
jgi:hypothetical protein